MFQFGHSSGKGNYTTEFNLVFNTVYAIAYQATASGMCELLLSELNVDTFKIRTNSTDRTFNVYWIAVGT